MVEPKFEPRQPTLQLNLLLTTIIAKGRSLRPFWVVVLMHISVVGAVRTTWGRKLVWVVPGQGSGTWDSAG